MYLAQIKGSSSGALNAYNSDYSQTMPKSQAQMMQASITPTLNPVQKSVSSKKGYGYNPVGLRNIGNTCFM